MLRNLHLQLVHNAPCHSYSHKTSSWELGAIEKAHILAQNLPLLRFAAFLDCRGCRGRSRAVPTHQSQHLALSCGSSLDSDLHRALQVQMSEKPLSGLWGTGSVRLSADWDWTKPHPLPADPVGCKHQTVPVAGLRHSTLPTSLPPRPVPHAYVCLDQDPMHTEPCCCRFQRRRCQGCPTSRLPNLPSQGTRSPTTLHRSIFPQR